MEECHPSLHCICRLASAERRGFQLVLCWAFETVGREFGPGSLDLRELVRQTRQPAGFLDDFAWNISELTVVCFFDSSSGVVWVEIEDRNRSNTVPGCPRRFVVFASTSTDRYGMTLPLRYSEQYRGYYIGTPIPTSVQFATLSLFTFGPAAFAGAGLVNAVRLKTALNTSIHSTYIITSTSGGIVSSRLSDPGRLLRHALPPHA